MKKISKQLTILSFAVFSLAMNAQKTEVKGGKSAASGIQETQSAKSESAEKAKFAKPYNPKANAEKDLEQLMLKAKKENKNILIQAGGNWCVWCLRFNNFVTTDRKLKEVLEQNYLYYHLNYSPENKNEKIFAKYGNAGEKFGYPFFIILDGDGNVVHMQPSEMLEEGKSYSVERTNDFLQKWGPRDL